MATDGAFVQQTPIFNFNDSNVNSLQFQDFMTQLTQSVNNMALVVNMKDTGYYQLNEYASCQFWYPDTFSKTTFKTADVRPGFRTVYKFALQDFTINPTENIPHLLTLSNAFQFSRMFGVANLPGSAAINLPFVSATAANIIEVDINSANIVLTSNKDYSAYTNCTFVLEYLYY